MDGWPKIDTDKLPTGTLYVPVLVDDNGAQYDTTMIAGQIAFDVVGDDGKGVQPRSDWFMVLPKGSTFVSSATGPQENAPLLEKEPGVDYDDCDEACEGQCLLFPELEHPAPTDDNDDDDDD